MYLDAICKSSYIENLQRASHLKEQEGHRRHLFFFFFKAYMFCPQVNYKINLSLGQFEISTPLVSCASARCSVVSDSL